MELKQLTKLIQTRRSIPPKFYTGEEIPEETIMQILENANWAPNHKNTEPWRFIIYRGEGKQKLGDYILDKVDSAFKAGEPYAPNKAEKFRGYIQKAPVVVAIIFERDEAHRLPEWEEIAAVYAAVQNMWLTATAMGLSAFWSTPAYLGIISDYFKLKKNQKSLGFFFLGKSKIDYPSPGRGPVGEKVTWIG